MSNASSEPRTEASSLHRNNQIEAGSSMETEDFESK